MIQSSPFKGDEMKIRMWVAGALFAASLPSQAGPGAFIGLTYNWGGGLGLSFKVLSTNQENRPAFAGGVSYFPMSGLWGIDAGAGYVFRSGAATISWDFLNNAPQFGLGYVKTKNQDEENNRLIQYLRSQQVAPPPPPPPDVGS